MPYKKQLFFVPLLLICLVALAACSPAATTAPSDPDPTRSAEDTGGTTDTGSPETPEDTPVSETPEATNTPGNPDAGDCGDPFEGVTLRFGINAWPDTNFCKHSVDYSEIISGGPPPDGITPIDEPKFAGFEEGDDWLDDNSPVLFFEWNGEARAYPLGILIQHEIVNDVVGGQPVSLTYCPLCNATIAFNRVLPDGTVLDFGTSGNLRNSDLVMWDRQTSSWWQQFTGTAIVGELTGTQLEFFPSQIISWGNFKKSRPDGMILSRDTGHPRDYTRSPYAGYDELSNNRPFLYDKPVDDRLPAMERVAAVELGGINVAYPFATLASTMVANDTVSGENIVVFWVTGTASAIMDTSLGGPRNVGATAVYGRDVDGQTLTFRGIIGGFEDEETGSTWNIFGEATDGPLAGQKLVQVVSAEHFWFAWAAFKPDTIIWAP